ncbi:MAG TPA: 50S ribosomal protein L37ae [Candidatus Nanoarchaeia archaeon]|nr:50S ribosomal protein L37ae [Candidatus Nanoarchaeia archaeon]
MPSHTKKVGAAGRFGARYGLRIRKKITEIESIQRQKHKCPSCFKFALKRLSAGIWFCNSCENKFAGGAYIPNLEKPLVIQEVA